MGATKSPDTSAVYAWHPFTFAGVAGLAMAPLWKFRLVRFVMAVFSVVCVSWAMQDAVLRTIRQAVQHLPDSGAMQAGKLDWPGPPVVQLAHGTVLTIVVDQGFTGDAGQVTDWQVVFGKGEAHFHSVYGFYTMPYAPQWDFSTSRNALEPWWGAWEPMLLAGFAGGALIFFFLVWGALGFLYGMLLRVLVYFIDRQADFPACWRAGQATLFSGALLLDIALIFYAQGRLDLLGLAFAFALHLVVPWIFMMGVPWCFPQLYSRHNNPFAARE